jgi:CBS domain-containing protein
MVGMGAMMGGTMRSPLTGMVFTLELTHDLNVLPALLISCVAAMCVTVLLLKRSILTEKLARRGQHITREYSVDLFELNRVGDVMEKTPPTIPAKTLLNEISARIAQGDPALTARHALIVVDDTNRPLGILTRGDIMRRERDDSENHETVLDAATTELVVTYPDEPLHDAIGKMLHHDIGRLPVVSRENPAQLVGYLGRGDILAARWRHHQEENEREKGPLFHGLKRRIENLT